MAGLKILKALSFSLFFFGFAGWVYICLNAVVHPETLSLQLTHKTPWIREDEFGILCFAVSFVSFLIWNLIREFTPKTPSR